MASKIRIGFIENGGIRADVLEDMSMMQLSNY